MIRQHPPPETDSAPTHPGEPGRLVLYRDGLLAWGMIEPRGPAAAYEIRAWDLPEPSKEVTILRLEVERHSLWHSRLNAARGTGVEVPIRGRRWSADVRGRFTVTNVHEDGGGPVGVELEAVEPVQWYAVDG